ncbi:MAG TPA: lysylphosphatidylglycerol synthase transmembrane domain-containing protein [Opitutaceae bacterium]|nr:lysylphosphatidylglycerol synthase transmembrane domain-containing protein [Opitutaceae bacterium]
MRGFFAFLDSPVGRFLRYALSVALVAGFIWGVDWSRLAGAQGRFAIRPALIALLLAGLTYPLHGWRWWLLLRSQGLGLNLHWAHWVTWISQFYNAFLLGGLGGDVARVFYICRDEPGRKAAGLATIVLDRVMGLVVLMSLAAVALVTKTGVLAREPGLRWVFIISFAVTVGGALAAVLLLRLDPRRWPAWLRGKLGEPRLATIADLIARVRAGKRDHALALFSSYAIWLLDIAAVWLLAGAVGLSLPLLETCIAVAVAYAVTALPISVGGHGVRESALLGVLGLFALLPATEEGRNAALLLAVLVWAVTIVWSLAGGIVVLAARRLVPVRVRAAG